MRHHSTTPANRQANVIPFRPRLVVTRQAAPDKLTVELLTVLLKEAIRGDLQGLVVAFSHAERGDVTCLTGTYRDQPEKAVAAALQAAWRLSAVED